MDETVFFNQGGVSVSNARFIVHGQTYAMNGVTSVKQGVKHPSRGAPVVLGIVGLLLLLGGSTTSVVWAVIILAIAALWWVKQKSEWIVVLNSSSGEAQALRSQDRSYIDGVIGALNQSIIHRG
jgi:hypothetical protein